jgi:hypothetical protein
MSFFSFSPTLARRLSVVPVVAAWSLIVVGIVSLPGCGGSRGPQVGKVQGVVTLDGKPLPKAQVEFLPQSGRPSMAETGEDGSYRLQYTVDQEGALVGPHTVKIHTAIPGRVGYDKELVPDRYHAKTELKAEVKSGSNKLDFDLTSK